MTALVLRPYQQTALDEIRALYGRGTKRVLLHLATGGGKTLIFCQVLKGVRDRKKRAIMVVKGKDLVDQASQRLDREGVPHGVMQGDHWRYLPHEPIQVCSIDTLYARRHKRKPPEADLIVIDEAHYAASTSFKWLLSHYEDAFFLPVTATPHVKAGMRHVADAVVYPITIKDLIGQGYLSPPRYFAPTSPNLKDVTIDRSTGDYKAAELGKVMSGAALYGDMVAAYNRYAPGRAAVCFAVHCEHSKALAEMYTAAGVPAEHVEADTSPAQRKAVLERLRTGETKIVCNVGILCVGVDIPFLGAVILARPTKSYNLFIQQVGRGTRISQGKNDFVVLDHANNLEEHGLIEYERECNLDGPPKRQRQERPVVCRGCYVVFEPPPVGTEGRYICPSCGFDNKPAREEGAGERKTDADGEAVMAEVKDKDLFMKARAQQAQLGRWCDRARENGYKPGWVFHKMRDKYGEDAAKASWREIKRTVPEPDPDSRRASLGDPSGAVQDWLMQSMAKPDRGSLS